MVGLLRYGTPLSRMRRAPARLGKILIGLGKRIEERLGWNLGAVKKKRRGCAVARHARVPRRRGVFAQEPCGKFSLRQAAAAQRKSPKMDQAGGPAPA